LNSSAGKAISTRSAATAKALRRSWSIPKSTWSAWGSDVASTLRWTAASVTSKSEAASTGLPEVRHELVMS